MSSGSTTCYWPNGQEVTEYNYQPCNAGSDPAHAACCDLRTSVCTENGYCIGNANYIYRGGCTDSTWMSGSCAQACSFAVEANLNNFANIFDCGNGTARATGDQQWCCGTTDGSSCCDDSFNVAFGRPYFPITTTSSAESSSTTNTATTTTTSPPPGENTSSTVESGSNATVTNPPLSSSTSADTGTDTQTIGIGVGVGVGVGALILGIFGYFYFVERRKRLAAEQNFKAILEARHEDSPGSKPELEDHDRGKFGAAHVRLHEAHSQSMYEVPG